MCVFIAAEKRKTLSSTEILSGIFGLLWLDNDNRIDSGPECKAFRVELGRDSLYRKLCPVNSVCFSV